MFNLFKQKPKGQQIVFKIFGMHCTSCAMNIDGALEDTDGVFSSETSYAKAEVKIDFDSQKVTEKKLVQMIKAEGYTINREDTCVK